MSEAMIYQFKPRREVCRSQCEAVVSWEQLIARQLTVQMAWLRCYIRAFWGV